MRVNMPDTVLIAGDFSPSSAVSDRVPRTTSRPCVLALSTPMPPDLPHKTFCSANAMLSMLHRRNTNPLDIHLQKRRQSGLRPAQKRRKDHRRRYPRGVSEARSRRLHQLCEIRCRPPQRQFIRRSRRLAGPRALPRIPNDSLLVVLSSLMHHTIRLGDSSRRTVSSPAASSPRTRSRILRALSARTPGAWGKGLQQAARRSGRRTACWATHCAGSCPARIS
jgi:hypothetical protein